MNEQSPSRLKASAPGRWEGVFAIPVTPFDIDEEIDFESLQRQVDFCVTAGAHGIVYPAVVSEFFTLSLPERMEATAAAIDATGGRVPFISGVSAASVREAATLAAHAREMGAHGVMAMLPYVQHFFSPGRDYATNYFRTIAKAAEDAPVILQNPRIGYQVDLDHLAPLLEEVPAIRYLKQETTPYTHDVTRALDRVGDRLAGVFGGVGGVYLLNELDRGACGTMPAAPFADLLVEAFESYRNGDRAHARGILSRLSPLFTLELLYNIALIKEVLYRRGVIAHTYCRVPTPQLDQTDLAELSELLEAAEIV